MNFCWVRPRGFGFITYTTDAEVDACQENRPHTVDGKQVNATKIQIGQSIPSPNWLLFHYTCLNQCGIGLPIQWGSEIRTCHDFQWSTLVQFSIVVGEPKPLYQKKNLTVCLLIDHLKTGHLERPDFNWSDFGYSLQKGQFELFY